MCDLLLDTSNYGVHYPWFNAMLIRLEFMSLSDTDDVEAMILIKLHASELQLYLKRDSNPGVFL